MTAGVVLLIFLAWWAGAGWYARRQALLRNLQEQPSLIRALLRGPLWMREMLIWSTLPPRQEAGEVAARADMRPSERTRRTAPEAAPGAVAAPAELAWKPPTAQAPSPAARTPEPQAPSTQPPAAPPLPRPTLPPIPAPADLQQVPAAALPVADAGSSEPPVIPVPAAALSAEPVGDQVPLMPPPRRLPGKPLFGTVKTMCPWCQGKRAYRKDARCPECQRPNPWLVGKWKLTDAPEERSPLPASAGDMTPNATKSPATPLPPVNQEPVVEPAAPATPLPPLNQEPVVEPAAPATVEDATLLPPEGAQRPRRIPGKPLLNTTVKTMCPWCQDKRAYRKDARCPECQNRNPWLADKWGLLTGEASLPAPSAPEVPPAAVATDLPTPQPAPRKSPTPDSEPELVALDASQELEPFDQLPLQPKRGSVKTVCPNCRERTKHERDGVCRRCGTPNTWLLQRWGTSVDPALPTPEAASSAAPAVPAGEDGCAGCGRSPRPDLEGNCMFCGTALAGRP